MSKWAFLCVRACVRGQAGRWAGGGGERGGLCLGDERAGRVGRGEGTPVTRAGLQLQTP